MGTITLDRRPPMHRRCVRLEMWLADSDLLISNRAFGRAWNPVLRPVVQRLGRRRVEPPQPGSRTGNIAANQKGAASAKGSGMLRTTAAVAAATLLAACGDNTVWCGPCMNHVSIAVIDFAEVPATPLRVDVCIEGGSCYRLHTAITTGDRTIARCLSKLLPKPAVVTTTCWGQTTSDGGWQIEVPLPEEVDGKTVTARSMSPGSSFEGHAIGELEPAEHGPCACPPNSIASIHAE
jgi:hypothetical protein